MGRSLKRLDVFGMPVGLNLGEDSKFRTSFGLFMSCSFYIALVTYLILGPFGNLFGAKEREFTYLATTETADKYFYAGNGRFKFAIGLQDKENAENIKDPRIFGIRAKYEVRKFSPQTQTSRTISYNLKVEPCRPDYFPKEIQGTLKLTEELYCLSEDQATLPEDEQGMVIQGRFDSSEQGKIVITMERCKVDCKPKEVIDERLGRSNIAIYTINYGISLQNKSNPFQKSLMGSFLSADSRFTKLLDVFMKYINVTSDTGYITNDQKLYEYVVVDGLTESISSEHDQIIFKTQIQMSSKIEKYSRNYKKIFSVIAEIGGFLKAFVLFAFLYRPFLKRLYFMEIINNLYRLEKNKPLNGVKISEEQEEKIKKLPKEQSVLFREKDEDLERMIESVKHKEEMERQEKEVGENPREIGRRAGNGSLLLEEPNLDEDRTKRIGEQKYTFVLKYNWMDWVAIICPCLKTKKHKLLDKGKKIVENNTDITVIIRKLQEFELLKKLILDKDQEILFNKIPKPNLLEIVDNEEKEKNRRKLHNTLVEDLIKDSNEERRENGLNESSADDDVLMKIERKAREREINPEPEIQYLQEVYDRVNKERNASAMNEKLLVALEEYIVKNRTEQNEEMRDEDTFLGRRQQQEPSKAHPSKKQDSTDNDIL